MQWSVVGHQYQKNLFENLLQGGVLAHGYIFSGPDGIGKRLFAHDITSALLNTQLQTKNPDFLLLAPGVHPDTGKPTDISVEDARALKVWAYQRPLYGAAKVVLIDDAQRLSDAAANTLLKILEEPPTYLYFFLITSVRGALLPTIASRCQEIAFAPLDDQDMDRALSDIKISAEEKKTLHAVAAGCPGIARTYVADKKIPAIVQAIAQLKLVCQSGVAERLVIMKTIAEEETAPQVVSWWLSWAHRTLGRDAHSALVLRGLLELSSAFSESKYNQRLALDRFALEAPVGVL